MRNDLMGVGDGEAEDEAEVVVVELAAGAARTVAVSESAARVVKSIMIVMGTCRDRLGLVECESRSTGPRNSSTKTLSSCYLYASEVLSRPGHPPARGEARNARTAIGCLTALRQAGPPLTLP